MRFLKEGAISKIYLIPNYIRNYIKRHYPNTVFKIFSIDKLIEKNNLFQDMSLLDRRKEHWGDSFDKYVFDDFISQFDVNNPIRIREKDLRILDGNHRIIALYNAGYKSVEAVAV